MGRRRKGRRKKRRRKRVKRRRKKEEEKEDKEKRGNGSFQVLQPDGFWDYQTQDELRFKLV